MKRSASCLYLLSSLLLSSCMDVPPGAYYDRGNPENLLQVSSDVIRMNLNTSSDVRELAGVLKDDRPTRAELNCPQGDSACAQAAHLLDKHSVPASYSGNGGDHSVTLVYQRTVARDCENRFIDNTRNNNNLPAPTMGCSVTANMVQMVTNKSQFTNPALLDYSDAEKAAQAYGQYARPSSETQNGDKDKSLLGASTTGQ